MDDASSMSPSSGPAASLDGAAASSSSVGLLVSWAGLVLAVGSMKARARMFSVSAVSKRRSSARRVEQRSGSKRYEQTWTRDDGLMVG